MIGLEQFDAVKVCGLFFEGSVVLQRTLSIREVKKRRLEPDKKKPGLQEKVLCVAEHHYFHLVTIPPADAKVDAASMYAEVTGTDARRCEESCFLATKDAIRDR